MSRIDPNRPEGSSLWSRKFRVSSIVEWLRSWKLALALGLGVGLRLIQYAYQRGYWMDERSLIDNIRKLSPTRMFGPLSNAQLAPPGFLVAEWLAIRSLGDHPLTMRLVPLISGIVSLFLMAAVARKLLKPRAVWLAVALFAVSGDLIYYASEVKQYSSDVTAALACLLMGLTLGPKPMTGRSAGKLAAIGSAIVWFSHPAIFVLAAVGFVGLARSIQARDRPDVIAWVLVGLAWVGSFACVHAVAMNQLGHEGVMWRFWAFAFPPSPPRSLGDLTWPFRRVALLFVDPLNFDAPIGPSLSMIPALVVCLVGLAWLGRVDRGWLALLLLPGGFALAASYLKLYPFHGRLLLFVIPSILLGIAAGLDRVREIRGGGWLYPILVGVVLGIPTATAVFGVIEPGRRNFHNPVGDYRSVLIDFDRFPF